MRSVRPRPTLLAARPAASARMAGFTLPEVLLSGVLGALLLTALAYATFQYTMGITHLEAKAAQEEAEDAVLRKMTRDIREAWWAEMVSDSHIRVADPFGDVSEYYYEDGNIMYTRPNGDTDVIFPDVTDLVFEPSVIDRLREDDPITMNGAWYQRAVAATPALALEVPAQGQLALAFTTPAYTSSLPSGTGDEQVLGLSTDLLTLPIAWVPDPSGDIRALNIYIHKAWAPGSSHPYGDHVGVHSFTPGVGMPLAQWDPVTASYEVPTTAVPIGLNAIVQNLPPGNSYTLVLKAQGNAQIVVAAHPEMPSFSSDETSIKDGLPGSGYVPQPLGVDYQLAGAYMQTASEATTVVSALTVTVFPDNRPSQTRSASIIGQAFSDNPWQGVVPGQPAP